MDHYLTIRTAEVQYFSTKIILLSEAELIPEVFKEHSGKNVVGWWTTKSLDNSGESVK